VSKARKFRVKNKLAMAVVTGGIEPDEALRRAEARLAPLRQQARDLIDDNVAEIDRRFGPGASGRDHDDLEVLYRLSLELIDAAAALPGSGLVPAAHALCTLVDLCQEQGVRDWEATEVHIDALRLLTVRGQTLGDDQRAAVLEGLNRILQKRIAEIDAPAPASGPMSDLQALMQRQHDLLARLDRLGQDTQAAAQILDSFATADRRGGRRERA
jgi:hypothetical protein